MTETAAVPAPSVADLVAGFLATQRRTAAPSPIADATVGTLAPARAGTAAPSGWVPVIGAAGGCGASTVALALAEAMHATQLIETCPAPQSNAAAVTHAELGSDAGWRLGRRASLDIRRVDAVAATLADIPPVEPGPGLAVVDVGWPPATLMVGTGWLPDLVRSTSVIVVVGEATVPGLRHVETALSLLGSRAGMLLAIVGPRRWPKVVAATSGRAVRRLREADQLIEIPHDAQLQTLGPSEAPLPPAIRAAGERLGHLVTDHLARPVPVPSPTHL